MRTLAGTLLIVAASICLGAAVIADNLPSQSGFRPQGIAYLVAMLLGVWGFVLLLIGLALDRGTDSPPTPVWVWILLLVLFLGILGLFAMMIFAKGGPA